MNVQRVLTVEQMKRAEEACFDAGLAPAALMEQAVQAIARSILTTYPAEMFPNVVVLAGKGGNGADGYGVARALSLAGYKTHALAMESVGRIGRTNENEWGASELNLAQRNFAKHCNVTFIPPQAELQQLIFVCTQANIVIDAIYGMGFKGELPEHIAEFFKQFKQELCSLKPTRGKRTGPVILALDSPSGLNLNGHQDPDDLECLHADETLTLGAWKPALLDDAFGPFIGRVRCLPLAIPAIVESETAWLLNATEAQAELKHALAMQSIYAHKYERGRAIIAAGSQKYPGARILALSGALAALPGYVQCTKDSARMEQGLENFPSVVPIGDSEIQTQLRVASTATRPVACLFGPGQTEFSELMIECIQSWQGPIVLDAGALGSGQILRLFPYPHAAALSAPRIVTPHRAEFEAIWKHFSGFSASISHPAHLSILDRARIAATSLNLIFILKGANTIIAAPTGEVFVHAGPNALLATAGTGDVLAGYLTGLLARGVPAMTAVKAAVVIHAQAAQQFLATQTARDVPVMDPSGSLFFPKALAKAMQGLTLRNHPLQNL